MPSCNYLKNKLLDLQYGKTSYTPATTLYCGLCTAVTAGGSITGEPTVGVAGYTRVAIANNETNFPNCSTPGVKTNGVAIEFPECVTAAWGTLTVAFLSDAASGNTNTLAYGTLAAPKTVAVGDQPILRIGTLDITMS